MSFTLTAGTGSFTLGPLTSPYGIMGGGLDALTNLHTQGRFKKYYWRDLQPTSAGAFSWADIDSQISQATAAGHQFTILLNLNSGNPASGLGGLPSWLIAAGAVAYAILNTNHSTYLYQFLSWDPVFLSNALNLIAAIGDRYDGKIASISMGGMGPTTEMGAPSPSPDGKTQPEVLTAWIASCQTLIAQYAAHFHKTTFVCALSLGGIDTNSLQAVVDWGIANYGARIGFENWGLNATSANVIPPTYLPNLIIYNHRLTNPVGFQMTGDGLGGGGDLKGTLRQAMDAGVALGAQYLQVFGTNTSDPANYNDLDAETAAMQSPPGGRGTTFTVDAGRLTADAGSFVLTGQPVNFVGVLDLSLIAALGLFQLTGKAVGFTAGFTLSADQGSFTLTGNAADFQRVLAAATGSFVLSGQAATFNGAFSFAAGGGLFVLSGQSIGLLIGLRLTAGQGAFVLSGQLVTFIWNTGGGPKFPLPYIQPPPTPLSNFVVT